MNLDHLLSGTRYEGVSSIEELASIQYKEHINDRAHFPIRPHQLDLPCSTAKEAAMSIKRFEQATVAFVDAATALCEAACPAWEAARMRNPGNLSEGRFQWMDVFARYGFKKKQIPSWQYALPYGINVPVARKTNCYGYACNLAKLRFGNDVGHDLHPGELAGLEYWDRDAPVAPGGERYAERDLPVRSATVYNVLRKALADGLSLEPIKDSYPVYFAVSTDDYHWYRQDRTGYWSHKPGFTPVRNRDGDGTITDRLITNPMVANRKHYQVDYSQGGCFLWVPHVVNNRTGCMTYEPMDPTRPR